MHSVNRPENIIICDVSAVGNGQWAGGWFGSGGSPSIPSNKTSVVRHMASHRDSQTDRRIEPSI